MCMRSSRALDFCPGLYEISPPPRNNLQIVSAIEQTGCHESQLLSLLLLLLRGSLSPALPTVSQPACSRPAKRRTSPTATKMNRLADIGDRSAASANQSTRVYLNRPPHTAPILVLDVVDRQTDRKTQEALGRVDDDVGGSQRQQTLSILSPQHFPAAASVDARIMCQPRCQN